MRPFLAKLLVLLSLAAFARPAPAQMPPARPPQISAIELPTTDAWTIVVGRVADFADPDDGAAREASLVVEETLKGPRVRRIEARLSEPSDGWKTRGDRLLVFVPWDPDAKSTVIDLSSADLAVLTADLRLLRNPEDVLRAVRDRLRAVPNLRKAPSFTVSQPVERFAGTSLVSPSESKYSKRAEIQVPIDEHLERYGREAIRAPDPVRRFEGIAALRLFKSKENAARLRGLFEDPTYAVTESGTDNRGVETRRFTVRAAADEVLRSWGEPPVPPPVLNESVDVLPTLEWLRVRSPDDLLLVRRAPRLKNLEIYDAGRLTDAQFDAVLGAKGLTSLSLTGAGIDDARMRRLADLRELRAVNLAANPFTDVGLRELWRLPWLKEATLNDVPVTSEGIAALRRAHPGILLHPYGRG